MDPKTDDDRIASYTQRTKCCVTLKQSLLVLVEFYLVQKLSWCQGISVKNATWDRFV